MKQVILAMLITGLVGALFMGGCSQKENEPTTPREAPGKLVRVIYERTNGSVYGDDFDVDVTADEILTANYFDEYEAEYQFIENQAITEEQWSKIEQVVLPMIAEIPPWKEPSKLDKLQSDLLIDDAQVLDGGDSQRITLVWDTADGELTEIYGYSVLDSYYNVTSCLVELVVPK